MEFASINKARLKSSYLNEKKSIAQIAKELNTNTSKIRRSLIFLGVEMRNYSEAQKVALDSGTATHPTKGKKLTKETIDKISVGRSKAWTDLPESDKNKIRKMKKEQWEAMTPSAKEELRHMAHVAIRESASIGSKTERFVAEALEAEGFGVIVHARNLIQSQALEVDLFVPGLKTAIEIDGISHFEPIWGMDKLNKQQSADATKQGLILANGYVMIRIHQLDKTMSMKRMNDIYEIILEELKKIGEEFPPLSKRLIEIEVNNGVSRRL
jgi:very-short-patch-repair endonuclease